jgi:hypothetical protein
MATENAFFDGGSSPPSTTTIDREVLAQRVITAVGSIATKLTELEADIRALWVEFENLPAGETILGCSTKKQFCETKLHRTPRAVRYLLNGDSNPDYVPVAQREEIISPAPEPTAAPAVEDDPELAETEVNARFTTIGLYRKRTFDELPQETAEKELLKSAEDFLEQSASIPNNLREELQSRNLLTPELDTKLTRVAQAAKQTNQPTRLQAEFHQLKPLFSGTGASLQFSETGYAIVGLTATQVEKIAKVLLRAVGVNTLQTQLAKAPNAT